MHLLINTYQFLMLMLMLASAYVGLLANFLFLFLAISCVYIVMLKLVQLVRGKITFIPGLPRDQARPLFFLGLLRCLSWSMVGFCITYSMIPIQFPGDQYSSTILLIWSLVGVLCVCAFFPAGKFSRFASVSHGIFLFFLLTVLGMAMLPAYKKGVKLDAPFEGKWYVFQGGGSPLISHHYFARSQRHALDLIKPEDGAFTLGKEVDLSTFATFNQPIFAPVDGTVIFTENSHEDNPIGKMNAEEPAGNHVVIKAGENLFILLAHFKKGSIQPGIGDEVKKGDFLGHCGNSGNSSQPHLHIQAMSKPELFQDDNQPIPILFQDSEGKFRSFSRNDILERTHQTKPQ